MKRIGLIVLAALALDTARASAAELSYVLSYNGPATAYSVRRSGERLGVTPFLTLLDGDKVSVVVASNGHKEDGDNRIILSVGNQRVPVDFSTGVYCVGGCNTNAPPAAPNATLVILGNVVASLKGIFAGAQDDRYTDAAESMESRGGSSTAPIAVPLLAAAGQRIVSGSRALTIEWKGGKPPFTVSLYRSEIAAAVETVSATVQTATFPTASLPAGNYRVQIDDTAGQTGAGTFEAVAPDALPAPTADESEVAADASLPEDMRTTLGAAALLARAPAFGFEAYQRVAPLASSYEPAELLRYHLAEPT